MKKFVIVFLAFFLTNSSFAGALPRVYLKSDNNIYLKQNNVEMQLTFEGKDYSPKLLADGKQIIFIRNVKSCPYVLEKSSWYPADYDEIWSMDVDGSNKRCIVKNNYSEMQQVKDYANYLGSFGDLQLSPNGEKIYFLCQNCTTDAILYVAKANGTDIKRISNAHQLDMIGGDPEDEYYGYLVVGVRKHHGIEPVKWTVVLMDPQGNEIKEIDDLAKFWQCHKKM